MEEQPEGKIARLVALFATHERVPTDHVLRVTEIPSLATLKVHLHNLRRTGVIDLRVNAGFIERLNSADADQEPVNSEVNPVNPPVNHWKFSAKLIAFVMGGIALYAICMSSYYTTLWFMIFLPIGIAIPSAGVIVLYISFAIQASLTTDKGPVKYMLRVTAGLMIVFSIVSTIAGQYRNDLTKQEESSEQAKGQALALLQAEERSLVETIESTKRELDDNTHLLNQFGKDDTESKAYKDIFWKSYSLRKIRDGYVTQLADKRAEIRAYVARTGATQVEQNTFYTWIATLIPLNPTSIEFYLYLIPAVFWDIMAPLGLHIFLKQGR